MVKMINTMIIKLNISHGRVFGDDGGADDGASDVMVVIMVKMINTAIIKLNIQHGSVFGDDGGADDGGDDGCDDEIL